MFEFDQYEKTWHKDPAVHPALPYKLSNDVAEMSFLVWGEHCIECAAPACYQTCDLYQARPDGKCRRFTFGIYKNRQFSSLRGYGAEVSFKKWAVLAAMGNTSMESRFRLVWEERLIGLAARVINAAGHFIHWITADDRWDSLTFVLSRRLSFWLHRRNKGRSKPDAFVLEMYNPGAEVRMQLVMDYDPQGRKELARAVQIKPRFRTSVTLPTGYSRYDFERRLFQNVTETGLPFTISLTPEADSSAKLVFLSADFVTYRNKKVLGKTPPAIKCVVWDLDNSLWDGILLENDEVNLKPGVREILETLDQRGILLSIASKNDHDFAWRRLESLRVSEYFISPQINWGPKSESIKNIAKRLNIGLDTFAFIDDSPFERSEVAAAIHGVTCIDAQDVEGILQDERFQGSKTADAHNRRQYYQEAIVREEKQAEFGNDYLRFLAYCEIRLEVASYRADDFDRVAELVQRTNQLNFSGRKYERAQLREVLDDPNLEKYSLYCSDKFGSYGLIGFALVRRSGGEIQIEDLMLSCRVQGKMVEDAFFSHLEGHHNPESARRLRVNFKETSRNQPARQSLQEARFEKVEGDEDFTREVRRHDLSPSGIVHVTCRAGCEHEISRIAVESR